MTLNGIGIGARKIEKKEGANVSVESATHMHNNEAKCNVVTEK